MPRFKLQAPDGRTVTVEGDNPPTEQDLDDIFKSLPPKSVSPRAEPESLLSKAQALSDKFNSAQQGAMVGALKGAGNLALQTVTTPQRLAGMAVNAVAGHMGLPTPPVEAPFVEQARQALTPQGTAQQVGAGVVNAAPSVALGFMTGGSSVPLQMATQAGLAAAQSKGNTPGQVASDAGLAAGGVAVGNAIGWGVGKLADLAVREYTKALAPTKEVNKAIAEKIAPELVDRGVTGSLETLAAKGRAGANTVGEQLKAAYDAASEAGKTIDANKLGMALEKLKQPFMAQSSSGAPVVLHEGAIKAITTIQDTLGEFGDAATPSQLWKFRQVLDDVVQQSNGFTKPLTPQTATAITRSARGVIQDALKKAVPVDQLNADYQLWIGLSRVAGASAKRQLGQSGIVGHSLRAAGAAGLGTATLGPGGVAMGAVPYIYTRPAMRTAAAVAMDRASGLAPLAPALAPAAGITLGDLLRQSGGEQ